jgi:hypothetical protein
MYDNTGAKKRGKNVGNVCKIIKNQKKNNGKGILNRKMEAITGNEIKYKVYKMYGK